MKKTRAARLSLRILITIMAFIPAAAVLAQEQTEVFDTAGNHDFTVPPGVTEISVEVWGAGGRGGDSSGPGNRQAGGAGGGGFSSSVISVTPGQTYNLFVGVGSSSAQPGQDSWFGAPSVILARGGQSVAENVDDGAPGGAAIEGTGDVRFSGGHGANRPAGNRGGGGGSSAGQTADGNNGIESTGGAAPEGGGAGGDGSVNVNQSGSPGLAPGGGGGGAFSQGSSATGGAGANGQVMIRFLIAPEPPAILQAEWRMDEPSWTDQSGEILDSSGNGNHATARTVGSSGSLPSTVPGKVCNAGRFRGQGFNLPDGAYIDAQHYADVPHDAGLSPLADVGGMSIGGWFQLKGNGGKLLHKGQGGNSQEYQIDANGGRLRFTLWDRWGSPSTMNISTQTLASDNWYFFAVTVWRLADSNDIRVRGYLYDETGQIGNVSEQILTADYTNKATTARLFFAAESFGSNPVNFLDGLLDEIRIYSGVLDENGIEAHWATTRDCPEVEPARPDHIRLIHSGQGLTCSPENVQVQACANPDCSELFAGEVVVQMTSPGGNWNPSLVTVDGSANVSLQVTSPGSVILSAVASDPPADNPTRCFVGGTETCSMQWSDSGFVLSAPNHVAATTQTLTVAAVRTDDTNQQCVPGLANQTRNVGFWSDYVNPSSGSLPVALAGNVIGQTAPGTPLSLSFDGSGVAALSLVYPDAGRIRLNARFEGTGQEAGLIMAGQTELIARPADLVLMIPGIPAATNASGPVFRRASEDFAINVTARNAAGQATPNFGREWPVAETAELEVNEFIDLSVLPPINGAFSDFGLDCNGNPAGGSACGQFNWPEVGIIALTPQLGSGNYLGMGLNGDVPGISSGPVGRFIPDHFALSSGELINRAALDGCDTDFSYLGERFDADFVLLARNLNGGLTQNYAGDFARLTASALGLSGSESGLQIDGESLEWTAGMGAALVNLSVIRDQPIPPYSEFSVSTNPVDSDGVGLAGNDLIDTTRLAFGRLLIDNAIGSELGPLALPWRAEYWDGNTWRVHDDDDCTSVEPATEIMLNAAGSSGFADQPVAVGTSTTELDPDQSALILDDGRGHLLLTAPLEPGWVDVELILGNRWPFLRDDLNDDDEFNENPEARATWGLFDGNRQRILLREMLPR